MAVTFLPLTTTSLFSDTAADIPHICQVLLRILHQSPILQPALLLLGVARWWPRAGRPVDNHRVALLYHISCLYSSADSIRDSLRTVEQQIHTPNESNSLNTQRLT